MANFVTMIRLALSPVFAVFMILSNSHPNMKYVACGIFVFGALTDWADGQIARRTNSVSEFGVTADPLADRVFIGTTLIVLYAMRVLPFAFFAVVLGRDVIMMLGYPIIGKFDKTKIAVHWTGKAATAVLFVSLSMLILSSMPAGGFAGDRFSFAGYPFTAWAGWQTLGLWLFTLGMVGSLVSGGIYVKRAIELSMEMKKKGSTKE
ncbi:MAG: CDP-alcohol phosphatidyltransferase family protein [Actinobacteria bacterium]|nr:CDP-alcohol phosphatidyltransferase family protein [Actinomycetota bacterium]